MARRVEAARHRPMQGRRSHHFRGDSRRKGRRRTRTLQLSSLTHTESRTSSDTTLGSAGLVSRYGQRAEVSGGGRSDNTTGIYGIDLISRINLRPARIVDFEFV